MKPEWIEEYKRIAEAAGNARRGKTRVHDELVKQASEQQATFPTMERYIGYESLIQTGRAVKLRRERQHCKRGQCPCSKEQHYWVDVHFAGDQEPDGSSRKSSVGFDNRRSAERASANLLLVLRQLEHEGKLNTDAGYNRVLENWIEVAKGKMLAEFREKESK